MISLNSKIIYKNIKKWMDTLYFSNPVIINFLPTNLNNNLINQINPKLNISMLQMTLNSIGYRKILSSE